MEDKDDVEMLEIVDAEGRVIGTASRNRIHGNPALIHKVVHVLVFKSSGELLLQKRSRNKDVAPGKWDTSAGGHMSPGESLEQAAMREMHEELGIQTPLEFLYRYLHSSDFETEMVFTFRCVWDGDISFSVSEIDEVRHWSMEEIRNNLHSGLLSGNFIHEFSEYMSSSK